MVGERRATRTGALPDGSSDGLVLERGEPVDPRTRYERGFRVLTAQVHVPEEDGDVVDHDVGEVPGVLERRRVGSTEDRDEVLRRRGLLVGGDTRRVRHRVVS